jgi:transposase
MFGSGRRIRPINYVRFQVNAKSVSTADLRAQSGRIYYYSTMAANGRFGSFASILACPHEVWSLGYSGHGSCPVEGIRQDVIQAPELERRTVSYELSDHEGGVIKPMLPNKPRGVSRVNDRRVLNTIFWVLRSGAPRHDLVYRYGLRTTCYHRSRWRRARVWTRLMDAISAAFVGDIQLINSPSVRAHHQGCDCKKRGRDRCLGRSQGGLTTKVHARRRLAGFARPARPDGGSSAQRACFPRPARPARTADARTR